MPSAQEGPAPEFDLRIDSGGRMVGSFPGLDAIDCIVHAVTTRYGPSFPANVDTPAIDVAAGELTEALGLRGAAWATQVHGDGVLHVTTAGLAGQADGLITSTPGLGVLGRSADCPLVLLAGRTDVGDSETDASHVVGMAHASWRSTVKGITTKVVLQMQQIWQIDPSGITATICPSAGPCCYEVGQEVRDIAITSLGAAANQFFKVRDGRLYFDLWAANVAQLSSSGVPADQIHISAVCTICRNDLFPSFRWEGKAACRFAGVIGITTTTQL